MKRLNFLLLIWCVAITHSDEMKVEKFVANRFCVTMNPYPFYTVQLWDDRTVKGKISYRHETLTIERPETVNMYAIDNDGCPSIELNGNTYAFSSKEFVEKFAIRMESVRTYFYTPPSIQSRPSFLSIVITFSFYFMIYIIIWTCCIGACGPAAFLFMIPIHFFGAIILFTRITQK